MGRTRIVFKRATAVSTNRGYESVGVSSSLPWRANQ